MLLIDYFTGFSYDRLESFLDSSLSSLLVTVVVAAITATIITPFINRNIRKQEKERWRASRRRFALDHYLRVRRALHAYSNLLCRMRWQLSAESLKGNGEHWYLNVLAISLLTSGDHIKVFDDVLARILELEDHYVKLNFVPPPEAHENLSQIRDFFRVVQVTVLAFRQIMKHGNAANPDAFNVDGEKLSEAIRHLLVKCYFSQAEVDALIERLPYRRTLTQKDCCPMPYDGFHQLTETMKIENLNFSRRSDITYSFLDTLFVHNADVTDVDRISEKNTDKQLARRIEAIVECTIFLKPEESTESEKGAGDAVPPIGALDEYDTPEQSMLVYIRRYVSQAGEHLLTNGRISKTDLEHWNSILNSDDLRIEPLFEVSQSVSDRSPPNDFDLRIIELRDALYVESIIESANK